MSDLSKLLRFFEVKIISVQQNAISVIKIKNNSQIQSVLKLDIFVSQHYNKNLAIGSTYKMMLSVPLIRFHVSPL